jgi:uncharacterized membrane protein
MENIPEKDIRIAFVVSLAFKAIGAAAQVGLGLMLLFSGSVTDIVLRFAQGELIEDPNDFFASHISSIASHASPRVQLFGALYLLSHGAIKIFLVWALIKKKLWAYPAAIAIFSLFILYQLAYVTAGNWMFVAPFALFEIFLLGLIVHEYRYLSKKTRF